MKTLSNRDAAAISVVVDLLNALERIRDMKDRDGNYVEMHPEEMRAIARTVLAKVEDRETWLNELYGHPQKKILGTV